MTHTMAVLQYWGNFTAGNYGRVFGKGEIYKKKLLWKLKWLISIQVKALFCMFLFKKIFNNKLD